MSYSSINCIIRKRDEHPFKDAMLVNAFSTISTIMMARLAIRNRVIVGFQGRCCRRCSALIDTCHGIL